MSKPFKYQIEDANRIHTFGGRCLISSEPGLGKTRTFLMYLKKHPEVLPSLVICPAFLRWHWDQEAKTHIGMRSDVLEGTKPPQEAIKWIQTPSISNHH